MRKVNSSTNLNEMLIYGGLDGGQPDSELRAIFAIE